MNKNFPLTLRLGICMPLSWTHISRYTHLSLLGMEKPDFIYLDSPEGGDLASIREAQADKGMQEGCSHIFFVDGDMVFPKSTLVDLFDVLENKGADLASIICYRRTPPYDPIIFNKNDEEEGLMRPFRDYQFGDLVDAGSTGAACLLVKRRVFEELERPWFCEHIEEKLLDSGKTVVIKKGEDTYFTSRAVKAGFKLKVITEYDIGHLCTIEANRRLWMFYGIYSGLVKSGSVESLYRKLQDSEWVKRELKDD